MTKEDQETKSANRPLPIKAIGENEFNSFRRWDAIDFEWFVPIDKNISEKYLIIHQGKRRRSTLTMESYYGAEHYRRSFLIPPTPIERLKGLRKILNETGSPEVFNRATKEFIAIGEQFEAVNHEDHLVFQGICLDVLADVTVTNVLRHYSELFKPDTDTA